MPPKNANNQDTGSGFRDYVESSKSGLKTEEPPKIDSSSLKIDTSIDFSTLDKAATSRVEMTSVADSIRPQDGQGIKVDLDLGKVEEGVRKIKAKQKTEQIRNWVEEAQKLIGARKYMEALKPIENAIRSDPESVQIRLLKAYCLFGLNDFEGTLVALREARPLASDGESVILLLILEGACGRALTQAIEAKLAALLKADRADKALALVEREIKNQPRNLALVFHRANILLMLGRVGEAESVVMEVLPHLGGENLQMFAALLASIKMRESQRYIDAARGSLRRDDVHGALAELAKCAGMLSGDEQYEAIRSYANSLIPRGPFGGLFQKDKPKPLTEATLQTVLGWLLGEEITAGVEAMKNEKFGEASAIFARADRIDARCRTICFLSAVAIFKAVEQAMTAKRVPDLEETLASFRKAASLLAACANDPAVGEQSRKFAEVIRSYQGQLETAKNERSRQASEAKPINELFEEFKSLMEGLEKHPISSVQEFGPVESKLKNIRSRAERLKKNATSEAQQALGQLLDAVKRNLDQVEKLRQEAKQSSSSRSSSSISSNSLSNAATCVQFTMGLKEKMDESSYFSPQESKTYGDIIKFVRTTVTEARAATYNSQELAALRQCEIILDDLESRL